MKNGIISAIVETITDNKDLRKQTLREYYLGGK